jgi:hypothetical protein
MRPLNRPHPPMEDFGTPPALDEAPPVGYRAAVGLAAAFFTVTAVATASMPDASWCYLSQYNDMRPLLEMTDQQDACGPREVGRQQATDDSTGCDR